MLNKNIALCAEKTFILRRKGNCYLERKYHLNLNLNLSFSESEDSFKFRFKFPPTLETLLLRLNDDVYVFIRPLFVLFVAGITK